MNQSQSHPSVAFYEMPVPIYVKGQGQDTTFVLDHTFDGEQFNVNVPFSIDSVFFDPERWILSGLPSILDLNELEFSGELLLFPNPASSNVMLKTGSSKRVVSITVYNDIGQKVSLSIELIGNNEFQLNTEKLPAGSYLVEIQLEDELIRKQLTKI